MSRFVAGARWAVFAALWAIALATPVGLGLASFLELEGRWPPRVRGASPLAWGLVGFDPAARRILVDSVAFAAGVSVSAVVLGMVATEWRISRGRGFSRWLDAAMLPAAVPPLALAVGVRELVRQGPWEEGLMRRLALAYVSLLWAVPLVMAWIEPVRSAVGSGWRERGRVYAGRAGVVRGWWSVVAPSLRPAAARAAAVVFLLCLLEPGAALALDVGNLVAPWWFGAAVSMPGPKVAALGLGTLVLGWGALLVARRLGGRHAVAAFSRNRVKPARLSPLRVLGDVLGLAGCLVVWWTPVALLCVGFLAQARGSGDATTLAERIRSVVDGVRALPLRLAASEAMVGLQTGMGVAIVVAMLVVVLGGSRVRLWDLRGVSPIPGLAAAAALASIHPVLPLFVVAVPLARSHVRGGKRRVTRRSEAERLLGVPQMTRWWRCEGRTFCESAAVGALAVVFWVLAETTILPLSSALGAPGGGFGVILTRALALGGDPELAPLAALALAAIGMAARAAGLRVAWFGAWPAREREG